MLTNLCNLHRLVLKAADTFIQKPKPDVIRCTELMNPPIIKNLMLKHWDEIQQDVSDLAWSMYGTSVHRMFEKFKLPGMIQDFAMVSKKYPISGTLDVLDFNTMEIMDFKTTSVWKVVFKDYDHFIKQLNLYKYLASEYGINIRKLTNTLILKDWKARDAKQDEGKYPKTPIVNFNAPVHTNEQTEAYIKQRIEVYETEPWKVCSPEDRWERVTYALMKPGGKRAVSTHDSREDAEKAAAPFKGGVEIIKRGGNPLRCSEYCVVRPFCPFGKTLTEN